MNELHKIAFEYRNSDTLYAHEAWQELEQYVKQLINEEREACVKACEQIKNDLSNWPAAFEGVTAETKFMRSMGETIAQQFIEAIQSRGQA